MLKKVFIFTVLTALFFSSFCFFTYAFAPEKSDGNVESYYLYDLSHKTMIAHKNTDSLISPSSTTKIMTACVIFESGIDLNKEITVTRNMLNDVEGRNMLLKENDVLTVEDLLYAMICGGYNDATHVLALSVSSSINEFVVQMNQKAQELNMNHTNYTNPSGLADNNMRTTVSDMVKLVKHMIQNERFIKICSTKLYKLSDKASCDFSTIKNRSSMLTQYKGLASMNVGSNDDGDCAVLFYKTDELSLISIVMNAKHPESNNNDNVAESFSKILISHALNDYSYKLIKTKTDIITSLPVKYSVSSKKIDVYLQDDLNIFLNKNISESELDYAISIHNDELIAPIKAGDTVGTLTVFYEGVLLVNVPLIVKENIEKNIFLHSMDMIKEFVLSKAFLIGIMIFIVLLILYFRSRKRTFKRKQKRKKHKIRKKPT